MKTYLGILLIAASLFAQTRIVTPAWVTCDGAAHAVHANEQALTYTVYALPSNSATNCTTTDLSKCPVVGDSNVAMGSRGFPLLPGASFTQQVRPSGQPSYSLTQVFYVGQASDKLVFIWAK